MNIKELCYDLYLIDWCDARLYVTSISTLKKGYYKNQADYDSFEEYLFLNGVKGECPVCFDEFIGNEYRDREYIKGLLCDNDLCQEYLNDITLVFNLFDQDSGENKLIWSEEGYSVDEIQACIDKMKTEVEDYTIDDLKRYLPKNCIILNPKTVVW